MKLFISYSHDDQSWVRELVAYLRDDISQHDVWLDQRLFPGQKWWNAILDEIENCEIFVPILTPRNISSIFCTAELNYALALNKPRIPLLLKPCDIPENLKDTQYITVGDDRIEKIRTRCEKAIGELRLELHKGKYLAPNPRPPR